LKGVELNKHSNIGEKMPKRIQRKRVKGWRMPENAIYVGRPTKWGNPFPVDIYGEQAIELYRRWLLGDMSIDEMSRLSYEGSPQVTLATMRRFVQPHELRGKDLACWCKEGSPCHADILLRLANQ
jgi:hypothetical protein